MTHQELTQDIAELMLISQYATRPNVNKLLKGFLETLQEEFDRLPPVHIPSSPAPNTVSAPDSVSTPDSVSAPNSVSAEDSGAYTAMKEAAPRTFDTKITSYAWDQSDKFVKIYATALTGVQGIPAARVQCEFNSKSFHLTVSGLNGKNHHLNVVSLHSEIDPAASKHKVKSDSVLVMLKKATEGVKWDGITELAKIKKQKSEQEKATTKDDDPQASVMNLMKKMYDEGDDDMKRTIAKAWTESRDKKGNAADMAF